MNRLLVATATVSVLLLAAGCGGASGSGGAAAPSTNLPKSATKATKPLFPAGDGPSGAERRTPGPVSIAIPSTFEQHGDEVRRSKSTMVTYTSTRREGRQRAAIGVSWSNSKHTKSAEQEAQAFRGKLLDVDHVKDLRMVRVSWPGLRDAYQFTYTDHNVSPGVQAFVLMGSTRTGQFVSVTATAPPKLVQALRLTSICGSMRITQESADT